MLSLRYFIEINPSLPTYHYYYYYYYYYYYSHLYSTQDEMSILKLNRRRIK